ncbi:MAG: polyprenyl synthetase family protein [Deltaproteobacteria bacterium]|nr:polyprenyl synthetase family protein [Deltaproteobacteria bacterium]
MNLNKYLQEREDIVNKELDGLLPKEDEFPQRLHKAMRYSVFTGGKRIRPILVIAAAEVFGKTASDVINTACAIELIHTYSLIHDDLPAIDNDDLRRGMPTNHKIFGEAMAILVGDALLTKAFQIISQKSEGGRVGFAHHQPLALIKVIHEIAKAAGSTGMVGGQIVDIESEGKEVAFPVLEYIHIHKTGELILASCRAGAIMANAGDKGIEAITRYGEAVGLAFQIADDILDVEGNKEDVGKNVGGDAKKGKVTYPSVLGIDESRKRAMELVDIAIAALEGFDEKAEHLRAIARYIVERKK